MTTEFKFVIALLMMSISFAGAATIARDAEEALALAEKDGLDIAVLVRGSDFCGAGESIMNGVWSSAKFSKKLGDKYVIFNVDHREWWQWNNKISMLQDRKPHSEISLLEIDTVKSEKGAELKLLPDGSFLASGEAYDQDVYSVNLAIAEIPYGSIVIDALTDDSMPGKGPGRSSNGNFWLTEVTGLYVVDGVEHVVKFDGAWGDPIEGSQTPFKVIDGDMSNDNAWAPHGHRFHKDSRLMLTMSEPVPVGASLALKLSFMSKHSKAVAGRMKFSAFRDDTIEAAVRERHAAKVRNNINKILPIKTGNYPAVLVFDSSRQLLGAMHAVPYDISSPDLIEKIEAFSAKGRRIDRVWEDSQKASGIEKASLLGEWLDLKGCSSSRFGHKNIHKPVFEELQKLDPEDQTDYVRKYGFDRGAIDKEAGRLSKEVDPQAAIDYLDSQISDPHNSRLTVDQIQNLYLSKWRIYRGWKEQSEKVWDMFKKIADIDRNTFLGIGSEGKLLCASRGGPVTMRHGWRPYNIKRGRRTMVVNSGVDLSFIDAGAYEVTLTPSTDGSPLVIHSMALFVEGDQVSRDDHLGRLISKDENVDNAYMLSLPTTCYDKEMELRIEYEALDGTDCNGRIAVRHVLPWEMHLLESTAPIIKVDEELFLESAFVEIKPPRNCISVYYTTDGSRPSAGSQVYKKPFRVNKTMTIKATALFRGTKKYFGRKSEIKLQKTVSTEPDANGEFLLQSATAHVEGPSLKYDKKYDCIGYWGSKDAFVWWAVHFPEPGKYRIVLVQALDKSTPGNQYKLSVGEHVLTLEPISTKGWGNFIEVDAGQITIEKSCYEKLKVYPVSLKSKTSLMNLRMVKVIPVE